MSGHDKSEGKFYPNVLTRLGCDVHRITSPAYGGNINEGTRAEPGFFLETSLDDLISTINATPDLFLYVEPYGLIPKGIEQAPFATACILCDVHRDLKSRQILSRFFDHVFLYHRNYLKDFKEHPEGHVHWFPYACDLEVFQPLGLERDLDVAFVGQLFDAESERSRVIKKIAARWKVNEQRLYFQHEIPGVYSRSKIVVNFPLADDLNFRFFEAMSCGALLLTRRINNGQEILFQEGEHFAAFANEEELFAKVEFYLAHPEQRDAIANAGHAEVVALHGLDVRLEMLLEEVKKRPDKAAPVRSMSRSALDHQYAWLYEYWRSLDAGAKLVSEARRAGRSWMPLVLPAARSFLRGIIR